MPIHIIPGHTKYTSKKCKTDMTTNAGVGVMTTGKVIRDTKVIREARVMWELRP